MKETSVCPASDAPGDGGVRELTGFIGRDPANRLPERRMKSQATLSIGGRYRVISFHTEDDLYATCAKKLVASLDALGIAHRVVSVGTGTRWEENCARKAAFVRAQWEASDVPVVWLDADATVEKVPDLFSAIDCDFAAHKWQGWQLGSGTLYFGKTDLARALLDRWVVRCEADPTGWDQDHLQSAWCDVSAAAPLRTVWLPRAYLQIFDAPIEEEPVIVHWQASRAVRASEPCGRRPRTLRVSARGMEDRRDDRLWRSREEAFWIDQGVRHIRPDVAETFPEGFDVGAALGEAIGGRFPVLEVGCGVGRIAALFPDDLYVGVDVNPAAVAVARANLPSHELRLIDDGFDYPDAETIVFYTVLLHLDGVFAVRALENACARAKRIVIAEIMDSRWRRGGNPPVFNRDPEHYVLAMRSFGFELTAAAKHVYARYDTPEWRNGQDNRITFLTFDRA